MPGVACDSPVASSWVYAFTRLTLAAWALAANAASRAAAAVAGPGPAPVSSCRARVSPSVPLTSGMGSNVGMLAGAAVTDVGTLIVPTGAAPAVDPPPNWS